MSDQSPQPDVPAEGRTPDGAAMATGEADEPQVDLGLLQVPVSTCEWGGGIIAGLGFFTTPILTVIPASLCAVKLLPHNRRASYGIIALLVASGIFWSLFYVVDDLISVMTDSSAGVLIPTVILGVLVLTVIMLVGTVLLVDTESDE